MLTGIVVAFVVLVLLVGIVWAGVVLAPYKNGED